MIEIIGGPDRDRTGDLFHAMEARSQLRHRPTLGEGLLPFSALWCATSMTSLGRGAKARRQFPNKGPALLRESIQSPLRSAIFPPGTGTNRLASGV
jgi:hypothetical protein